MKTEAEIKERLKHWKLVLGGVIEGPNTKKTLKHIIAEFEWILDNNKSSQSIQPYLGE